ncbi:hypothetical protein D6764_05010 [Candidatus Woesearchaeota archaeon]|nr:MAG: hypothetical protein D6764_05010 [Candidatus Woesearchaeota archaeon]
MTADELERIRNERMRKILAEQARAEMESQAVEEERIKREIDAIEARVKSIMTREALQRYGAVKVAHPELAMTVMIALAQSIEKGMISRISDEMLKKALKSIQGKKRDIRISRK